MFVMVAKEGTTKALDLQIIFTCIMKNGAHPRHKVQVKNNVDLAMCNTIVMFHV